MMICHYFSFLIYDIWLDWWNNILLFLFSALTELNLICGIWAFSIIRDRPLGYSGPGLHFELAKGGLGAHHFSGLGEWADEPVFLTLSVAPQPLCTKCVGKGCNSSRIDYGFHVSIRGWVN